MPANSFERPENLLARYICSMEISGITIRPILPGDDPIIAKIIRNSLEEFGANHPGTVYYDDSTDHLSELFRQEGAAYFIAENNCEILGGAGIFPTAGLPADTCELVKMYLSAKARGLGLGKKLMEQCLQTASQLGYRNIYLETMPELTKAVPMYEKFGFKYLDAPLGNSGHFGCAIQMLKSI